MLAGRAPLMRDQPWVPIGAMFPLEEGGIMGTPWLGLQTKPAVNSWADADVARLLRFVAQAHYCNASPLMIPTHIKRRGARLDPLEMQQGDNPLLPASRSDARDSSSHQHRLLVTVITLLQVLGRKTSLLQVLGRRRTTCAERCRSKVPGAESLSMALHACGVQPNARTLA
jgi:hypothetical protein